ncbi:MAG: AAA family ATPase [Candidatus Nealsonbacteria bacterium]|nr:AAA family ATPase [Candidatus Nealsonbacteria bacterium]
MISSIEITRFRGIREGKLEDLAPLTVLVGRNGCGKTSVLDALLVAGSRNPGEAIGQTVARHPGVEFGAPWLFWRRGYSGPAEVAMKTNYGTFVGDEIEQYERTTKLRLLEAPDEECRIEAKLLDNSDSKTLGGAAVDVAFSRGNKFSVAAEAPCLIPPEQFPGARLMEGRRSSLDTPLHELLSRARMHGLLREALHITQGVLPDAKELAIDVENGLPLVVLDYGDHAVPVALCGDGVYSLVSLSLELAAHEKTTVLFEEPEVHQHPGAMRQTVRAILAAVRRDIQVVLTTHSLELIDVLLAESSDEDLERLALYRMELDDGRLISARMTGPEVAFSRFEIENDLR